MHLIHRNAPRDGNQADELAERRPFGIVDEISASAVAMIKSALDALDNIVDVAGRERIFAQVIEAIRAQSGTPHRSAEICARQLPSRT